MRRTTGTETNDIESSTETEILTTNALGKMSDHEIENFPSISVTSEEVACQIRANTDPLTQQLAHLCELMRELENEQADRRHVETTSFRATNFSSSNTNRSDSG